MAKGKYGIVSLPLDEGAEEVLDEENELPISMIIQQYFLSLKILRHRSTSRKLFSGFRHDMQQSEDCKKHEKLSGNDIDSGSEEDDEGLDGESKDEMVVELLNKIKRGWAKFAGVEGEVKSE